MAKYYSQSNIRDVLIIVSVMLLVQKSIATQFIVGGSNGWNANSTNYSYNQWAEHNRFRIGDSLLFKYNPHMDAVLQVTKDNYDNCNTGTSIRSFTDGNTAFTLSQSGAYYFISGNRFSCQMNQKLSVVVLSERTTPAASPPPPPPATPPPVTPSPTPVVSSPTPVVSSPSPVNPPVEHKSGATSTASLGFFGAVLFALSVALSM